MSKTRVVVYTRGTTAEIAHKQEQCRLMAEQQGVEVVALATDSPDGSSGWNDANAIVMEGRAERILVVSRNDIPRIIESVTQHLPGRRAKRIHPPD